MKALLFAAVIVLAACSAAHEPTTTSLDRNTPSWLVPVDSLANLEVEDFPIGSNFVAPPPAIVTSTGTITATATRSGSRCRFDVSGNVSTEGQTILVLMRYAERFSICTADLRALRYKAAAAASAGSHDVVLIHITNGVADTVARRTIVVP